MSNDIPLNYDSLKMLSVPHLKRNLSTFEEKLERREYVNEELMRETVKEILRRGATLA